jgi:signal transduction histidine kinase
MGMPKKPNISELENRILELEEQVGSISNDNQYLQNFNMDEISKAILLFAEVEELDFLILDLDTNLASFLFPNIKSYVLTSAIDSDNFESIIFPEDVHIFQDALLNLKDKPYRKIQVRLSFGSDSLKDIKPVEISLIHLADNQLKILLVVKDISQIIKQRKDLIRSKEKIEESDKLKSTILSNISHYIRTPLNSVTGFSELLANPDLDSIQRREYIDIIKTQSKRILSLIDDLSEIAKLEKGNIIISNNPCNLNLILHELLLVINQQRSRIQRNQLEIKLDMPSGKGLELITDSGRLQQTIYNLVNYSLRYTYKGQIQIGYRLDDAIQKVIFFIKDTSSGLSREEQKVLFNKFTVLDNSEKNKFEDPGLGLTIARNIIKNLGGKIWVESEENKGNSFFFTLPYEPLKVASKIDVEEDSTDSSTFQWPNKVILIVDDEEVNAVFIEAVLQGTHAQVLYAKNGQEAVELCKSIHKIDLILMDLKMPVLNGIKATEQIREFNPNIPIIAQTALASTEDKHESLEAGCNDVLTKPIEVQELIYKVNKFLAE